MTSARSTRAVWALAACAALWATLAPGGALAQEVQPAPLEPPRDVPADATPAEFAPRPDGGESAQNAAAANEMSPALDGAISKGLAALAVMQNEDGSWGGPRFERNVALTSLACLALMADGNLPGRGSYSRAVERGLEFVLASVAETGLVAADTSHGPMYGHGFATLFLGEVYGMTGGGPDTAQGTRLYDSLLKACRLIAQSQNEEGGWRYNPVPHDADVSVTICQIMALRSARNAGLEISKDVIDKAVDYVRSCQNVDGGWRYQMMPGGSAWPRSAAGLASLYYAGIYEDQALDRGLHYLTSNALPGRGLASGSHYFYGHYYAVQAMYLAGGERWARWWPAIRDELLTSQNAGDGTWDDSFAGPAYGTAMALIILQMPKRYLPIFQK